MRILEIGVAQAENAERLLTKHPHASYLGIDRWRHDPDLQHEAAKLRNWSTQQDWDRVYLAAWNRLLPYGDRASLLRGNSHHLLPLLHHLGHTFDHIVIDGDHSHPGCLLDLQHSAPLLALDGTIFLDDLDFASVARAASEFAESADRYGLVRRDRSTFARLTPAPP